jgi:hypothetical protein
MLKRWLILAASLVAIAFLFGCNKQKPHKLDYKKGFDKGEYSATGLPGESYVGAPNSATKHSGEGENKKPEEVKKPEEAKKPEEN